MISVLRLAPRAQGRPPSSEACGLADGPVFEKVDASTEVEDASATSALFFNTVAGQLHWLRFPDAAALAGTSILLSASKLSASSTAAQSADWALYLLAGKDGSVGPFSFSGSQHEVELSARRAEDGAPLAGARLVFRLKASGPAGAPSPGGLSPLGAALSDRGPSTSSPTSMPSLLDSSSEGGASSSPGAESSTQPDGARGPSSFSERWLCGVSAAFAQAPHHDEDPAAPLERAARAVAQRNASPPLLAFLDPAVVSGLEALVVGAREGEAPGGGQERPARRARRAEPALEASEELLRRIDAAASAEAGADAEAAPQPPPAPAAALEAPALRGSGRRSERGGLPSGPALDSRFVSAPSGQRDLRRGALLLRAAARSVAPERALLGSLVGSAVNGILFFSRDAPEKLVAACERSWRLADALVPPFTGLAHDMALVPVPQLVQLARLAVAFLEPLGEESPRPYAQALSFLGYRLLQNLEDEEACKAFYAAWGLVKRRRLSPCVAESIAIRGIAVSHARRNQNEKAAETAKLCYWFESGGLLSASDFRVKLGTVVMLLRVALNTRDWPAIERENGNLQHAVAVQMNPEDPDYDNCVFYSCANRGVAALHAGRYVEFLAHYRRTLRVVKDRPGPLHASPLLDIRSSFRATPLAPALLVPAIRLVCLLQRTLDWRGETPLLAHFLYALGTEYARLGDAPRAASALREALKEYGRFPAIFPGDHPRTLAARAALAACSAPSPKGPAPIPESVSSPVATGTGTAAAAGTTAAASSSPPREPGPGPGPGSISRFFSSLLRPRGP
eukprot:tig00000113_g5600.t1